MKKFMLRWGDTILFCVHMLCVVALLVCNVRLVSEVRELKATLAECVAEKQEVVIVEVPVAMDIPQEPIIEEENTEVEYPKLYTYDDAVALAKTTYGEAVGVPELSVKTRPVSSKCQQAAVMWTVLNRYDAGGYSCIADVVKAPKQYAGYSPNMPVTDELFALAYDVLDRWNREQHGETDVGRVIPNDYMWFHGDGTYNWFRNEYGGKVYWDWSLEDCYDGRT